MIYRQEATLPSKLNSGMIIRITYKIKISLLDKFSCFKIFNDFEVKEFNNELCPWRKNDKVVYCEG